MRYAIISDVHGNIEALKVALSHLKNVGYDRMAFLGDAVGYGPNPNEVCEMIRAHADIAVLGNHDAAVAGRMDFSGYYDAAREALIWCQERISEANLNWLQQMPYKVREADVEFCHGAPVAPEMFDYLFGVEQVQDLLTASDALAPVTFIGHSHLTISFEIDAASVKALVQPDIACKKGCKYIITAGSVGQPRDRDPRTCCGVFDTESGLFNYHRLNYDIEATRQKIIDSGLSQVFGERLRVGI